jgi:type IV pilus assembly protein PilY1
MNKTTWIPTILIPVLLTASLHSIGDDTEIYLQSDTPVSAKPLVMLNLDYRPNLGSTVCGDFSDTSSACYKLFDEVRTDTASISSIICPTLTNGCFWPEDESKINFFELLRVVLVKVLEDLDGVQIALMMPHQDKSRGGNKCDGPGQTSDCSQGGYILAGFGDIDYDPHREHVISKLAALQLNGATQGNETYPFHGAEVYFELFRYLTGQRIHNGHNGFNDFDSLDNTRNLNEACDESSPTSDTCFPLADGEEYNLYENAEDRVNAMWDDNTVRTLYPGSTSDIAIHAVEEKVGNDYYYVSPLTEVCSRVFVVNFLFAVSNQDTDSKTAMEQDKDYGTYEGGLSDDTGNDPFELGTGVAAFPNTIGRLFELDLADGSWGRAPALDDDQNVTSYFVVNQQVQQVNQKGYALRGGTGSALAAKDDPEALVEQITGIFNEILSISTTFVSASVPANVFNSTKSREDVFFGLFQPELEPRWNGNIKRLKLQVNPDSQVLELVDQNGDLAISSAEDGRIKNDALTFWTNPDGFDVPQTNDFDNNQFAKKDGRAVISGGTGQQVPGYLDISNPGTKPPRSPDPNEFADNRVIYTDDGNGDLITLQANDSTANNIFDIIKDSLGLSSIPSWNNSLMTDLYDTNPDPDVDTCIDASDIRICDFNQNGVGDKTDVFKLIAFARGIDAYDEDGDYVSSTTFLNANNANLYDTESLPWMFGDILHSQPTPVDYGATSCDRTGNITEVCSKYVGSNTNGDVFTDYDSENTELYLITGTNDGSVRFTEVNDQTGSPSGIEKWSYIPRELLPNLAILATNSAADEHPYGVDTTITLLKDDSGDGTIHSTTLASDGNRLIAYFGLRRGGKHYYAVDITKPNDPELLWKIGKSDSDFNELGLTFSTPIRTVLQWDTNPPKPVIMFAGGYDKDKDDDSNALDGFTLYPSSTTVSNSAYVDDEGNAIFIVDALTGSLVWKAVYGTSGTDTDTIHYSPYLRDSIPSDLTVVGINPATVDDTVADTIYVGDTGGAILRADLIGTDRTNWEVIPIMQAGRHALTNPSDRRFFHAPSVFKSNDNDVNGITGGSEHIGIAIGSGNRAHPKETLVTDRIFMLKDRSGTDLIDEPDEVVDPESSGGGTNPGLLDITSLAFDCASETDPCTAVGDDSDDFAKLKQGWYMDLIQIAGNSGGEKMLSTPLVIQDVMFFSTYLPSGGSNSGVCGPSEGESSFYGINVADASAFYSAVKPVSERYLADAGSGILSDPVVVVLDGNLYIQPGNLGGKGGGGSLGEATLGGAGAFGFLNLQKTFWYESKE